ncbi:MAG: hypothetical protein AAFY57_00675 [Cyanobacteria bacterium J06642_2]
MASIAFHTLANALAPALEGMTEFFLAADQEEPRIALTLLLGAASLRFLVSVLFHLLGASNRN